MPGQAHELSTHGHDRYLAPPHRSLLTSGCSGADNVSTMSPATCPPSPRYIHGPARPAALDEARVVVSRVIQARRVRLAMPTSAAARGGPPEASRSSFPCWRSACVLL